MTFKRDRTSAGLDDKPQRRVRQRQEPLPPCCCLADECASRPSEENLEEDDYSLSHDPSVIKHAFPLQRKTKPFYYIILRNPTSIIPHQEITLERRKEMIDVMILLACDRRLGHITLHLAVTYFDRYMEKWTVRNNWSLLAALACLSIAAKMERDDWPRPRTPAEYSDPRFMPLETMLLEFINDNTVKYSTKRCTSALFKWTEMSIMRSLDFELRHITVAETQATLLNLNPGRHLVRKQYADFFGVCSLFSPDLLRKYTASDRAHGALLLANEIMASPMELCEGAMNGASQYARDLLVELSKGLYRTSKYLEKMHEDAYIMLIKHRRLEFHIESRRSTNLLLESEDSTKRQIPDPGPQDILNLVTLDAFIQREIIGPRTRPPPIRDPIRDLLRMPVPERKRWWGSPFSDREIVFLR